jgi:hypothetical protein
MASIVDDSCSVYIDIHTQGRVRVTAVDDEDGSVASIQEQC